MRRVADDRYVCPACGRPLLRGRREWHWVCDGCGIERSILQPTSGSDKAALSESLRQSGLVELRQRNFEHLLSRIETITPLKGKRVLDVGSAHGWFVERAAVRGAQALGIEPDAEVAALAIARGVPTRVGWFPDALRPTERFDVVAFNDVFEHVADACATLRACHALLNDGGLLVLNVPDSNGALYTAAKILDRLGSRIWFDRLWQSGFPSPHLSYFNASNLRRLVEPVGFVLVTQFALLSVHWRGLWARIRTDRRLSLLGTIAAYAAVTAALPLLALLPADSRVSVFRKS